MLEPRYGSSAWSDDRSIATPCWTDRQQAHCVLGARSVNTKRNSFCRRRGVKPAPFRVPSLSDFVTPRTDGVYLFRCWVIARHVIAEIGRASCWEIVCMRVWSSLVDV